MKEKIIFIGLVLIMAVSACGPVTQPVVEIPTSEIPIEAVDATATMPPPVKLNICYSAKSASAASLWYAQDSGIFSKYGLEVNLIYIASGSDAVTALISGDVDMCMVAGAAVVNAVAAGQDTVMIAGLYNRFIAGFYTTSNIKTPDDLRGATLAISRPGSSSTVGTLLVLDAFNLVADQDVTLISVGNDPERLVAMKSGQVSGAVLSPPSSIEAEREGFNKLFDLAASDIPYQFTGIGTTRTFIKSDRAAVISFMKALLETNARMKADPEGTKTILASYLELDPNADSFVLERSYDAFIANNLEDIPYPTLPGIQTIIDTSISTNPDVASVTPEEVVDMTIVAELEESGFISSLQTK